MNRLAWIHKMVFFGMAGIGLTITECGGEGGVVQAMREEVGTLSVT